MILQPQPVQERFLSTSADVCVFGSGAGVGKTFASIMDHIRYVNIPEYQGVIIRKSYSQIFSAGGLWDEAQKLLPLFGGVPIKTPIPRFVFPSGAQISFKHSQRSSEVDLNFQGIQADVITIDEAATGFTLREFLYISSRLRSMTTINSYIRLTCNPNPASFIRKMIDWYLLPNDCPDFSKSGVIRYYIMVNGDFIWADTRQEIIDKYDRKPLSFTFIPAKLEDNQELLKREPGYKEKLQNLGEQDTLALLGGSWGIVDNPMALFKQSDINKYRIAEIDHTQLVRIVVAVDPAGSHNKTSDETGIVAVGMDRNNICYILEDQTGTYTPEQWAAKAIALYDKYQADRIVAEKNYGGDMVESTIKSQARVLGRTDIKPKLVNASRGKHIRAEPVSLLYSCGEVVHVGYDLMELETEMTTWVPLETEKSPNRLDAVVWGVAELCLTKKRRVRALTIT